MAEASGNIILHVACLTAGFLRISEPRLRKPAWAATQMTTRPDGLQHLSSTGASSGVPKGLPFPEHGSLPYTQLPLQWGQHFALLGMDMSTSHFSLRCAFSLSSPWFIYPYFSCQQVRFAPSASRVTLICRHQLSLHAVCNAPYSWFYSGGIA